MSRRSWQTILLAALLLVTALALTLSFPMISGLDWQSTGRWNFVYELIGACVALEVAAFAISRYGLEGRRVPLFIGLAFLAAAISDAIAALVTQGQYLTPLVGETLGVVGVWTAGRSALAIFLWAGLLASRYFPVSPSTRAELVPAVIVGAGLSIAVVQLFLMVPMPGLLEFGEATRVPRPWDLGIALLMAAAVPGYWRLYREQGGSMLGSVLVSLVVAVFAQFYMSRAATLYYGTYNLATILKIASYFPPLAGLFIESVVLFRAQRKLTTRLQVAQAELSDYSKGLEKKVAERTRDLEARAKELEAFAYTVSHDLKAPLRGVQTYSQFLLDEYAPKLDETGRRYAESVRKAAVNMKQFIDDLLEYSRLDRREAHLAPVDLRGLFDSVLEEHKAEIEQYHAQVTLDINLPQVMADRAILRQAIANLVDNGLKYSRNAKPPRLTVRGSEDNGDYLVTVVDNGVGFDMEHKDRIFQIFQRLQSDADFEGTGIGLSTVRKAIEKHGGRIWVESQPGKGAAFTFTLPKRKPPAS